MEKKTVYIYKNNKSYKSNEEYRIVTFINGDKDIIEIIKEENIDVDGIITFKESFRDAFMREVKK